jgi:hypothetical protein
MTPQNNEECFDSPKTAGNRSIEGEGASERDFVLLTFNYIEQDREPPPY